MSTTVEFVPLPEVSGTNGAERCYLCGEPASYQRIVSEDGDPMYGEARCTKHSSPRS